MERSQQIKMLQCLEKVRLNGHHYVQIREDEEYWIFLCVLCYEFCYDEDLLKAHLKSQEHSKMLVTAKATLLKRNPWPFNDGVFFFHEYPEEVRQRICDLTKSPKVNYENAALALLGYDDPANQKKSPKVNYRNLVYSLLNDKNKEANQVDISYYASSYCQGSTDEIVISGVLQEDGASDLVVNHRGVGVIGARVKEEKGISNEIQRIWCEWLGNKNSVSDELPEHDLAVVTFTYDYSLSHPDLKHMPTSYSELRRTGWGHLLTCSESEDEFAEEESQSSKKKVRLSGNEDQQVQTQISYSKKGKSIERLVSEKLCAICEHKFLLCKDVAALLNRKTGKLVCSSRNSSGAFHVFHTSCLLHWVLFCEFEIYANQSVVPEQRSPKSNISGAGEKQEMLEIKNQLCSVSCPECQGTGITTDASKLELETPPLSSVEIKKHMSKLIEARKEWMNSPEVLEHCSMGLCFSGETNEERVASLKVLHFYHAAPKVRSAEMKDESSTDNKDV